jgi:L-ascorbate metabolism protein UlaG (beta-lactamase superfamily)
MNHVILFGLSFLFPLGCGFAAAGEPFQKDTIKTIAGDLTITFIGHGTLVFSFDGKEIHIDPWSKLADYSGFPKADIILITHDHRDHLDPQAIRLIRKDQTIVVCSKACGNQIKDGIIMKNTEIRNFGGVIVEAVPAYNFQHKREDGQPFHPKGMGNGYVITFGDVIVYVAGDTENISEMKTLKNIDIAFLPMNLPYTMTPEMVADAVKAFKPKILYPYHFGDTDMAILIDLLKNEKEIELRIRNMK